MSELLLEIGTEEIPSAYIPPALGQMSSLLEKELQVSRIPVKEIKSLATPRRLVLTATGIGSVQEGRVLETLGPAKPIAFDKEGKPTRAALGFAKSQGVSVEDLQVVRTEKGEYVCARREEKGAETFTLLPEILPRLVQSISFPKSMRWMDLDISFVRPIHWILCLFDGKVVPFSIGNISSGNLSRGHRFMAPGSFQVKDLGDYLRKLKNSFVLVNPDERKESILAETSKAAAEVSGRILADDPLLETVANLTEYPVALRGGFAEDFLSLPKEVLISAMREHQKYFSITDEGGNLLPWFVAVSNTKPRDPKVVIRGNERVLHARLSDAKFFFIEDQKIPLFDRLEGLKKVVYHSKLGTSYEKVMRVADLAESLAARIRPDRIDVVKRAALLCKGDLITGMVGEFPTLQGIMGSVYARLSGESGEVSQAIYEHYQPVSAGGALPSSDAGAILSLADKTDTIVGCFGVGLIPSGTADPYALRRQTLGVINIILEKGYLLRLDELFDRSLALLEKKIGRPAAQIKQDVLEFFQGRVQNLLITKGFSPDAVDAALTRGCADLVDLQERARALDEFKKEPDFDSLALTFKRVVNISRSAEPGEIDPRLFEAPVEKNLYEAYRTIGKTAEERIGRKEYLNALKELSALRKPVDEFFDGVMVMAKDEKIRRNRLSLLSNISRIFFKIGDFSKITTK